MGLSTALLAVLATALGLANIVIRVAGILAIGVLALAGWVTYRLIRAPIPVRRPLRPLSLSIRWEGRVSTATKYDALHSGVAIRLERLLNLIKRHYIWPWYSRLSPSDALPDAIEALVRQVLLNATIRGSQIDWPDLLVSRIVPILKAHLEHYQKVQHLSGQLPLPLPPDSHPAFGNQTAAIDVHLAHVVERIVHGLLPAADQTLVVKTLVREIMLSIVLPIFDVLADGDFWNRQIDEKGDRYLHERKQVHQFLSRLSALPEPTTPVKRPVSSITAHSTSQQIDAFVRYIDKVKTVGEARRLRADVDRELRSASGRARLASVEEGKRVAKYIKRLDRARRHVDARLATLGQVSTRPDPVADFSLATVMSDSSSVAYLLEYMERRGQSNLVQFWLMVETLKDPLEGEQALVSAEDIAFIADAYLKDLDLAEHLVTTVMTAEASVAKQGLFSAQRLVFERIEEYWDDFSRSELYRKAAHDLSRQPVVSRHVSDPIKILKSPTTVTPLNRSITDMRLEHTPKHLDALIGPEEQPTGKLFMDDDEEMAKMEAIQAALEDTMDDETTPPAPSGSQSLSASFIMEAKSPGLESPRLFDDMAEDPIIQQAADGDLHLDEEIKRLDEKIQELVKQRSMLDGFVRRAELTGNDGELRLLHRSLSSIRLDLRASVFQKAQYEHQEQEGRLAPGRTTIEIPNAVVTDQNGKPVARYAVKISQRDESVNTAWVVYRRYNEFFELDRALRDAVDLKRIDLPGKRLGPSTSSSLIESRRVGLEKYLQALIYTSACDSAPLRDFLSRSSSFSPTRATLAPQTIVQSLYNTMAASLDESLVGPSMIDIFSTTLGRQFSEVAEGLNGVVGMGGDLLGLRPGSPQKEPEAVTAFTAPICDLVIELLDLDESNWIKRQAIEVVLQQILGSTIERKVRETMRAASQPPALSSYLDTLEGILFPEGEKRPPSIPRTEDEKAETKRRASKRIALLIPESSLGALLLHTASFNLLADVGAVFGISGILDGAILGDRAGWRLALVGGMVAVPVMVGQFGLQGLVTGNGLASWSILAHDLPRLASAGFLVGAGSRIGSGCTRQVHTPCAADLSGHFLCGASRLSKRSIIATLTFFPTAILTALAFPLQLASSPYPAYRPYWPSDGFVLAIPIVISSLLHNFALPAAQKAREGSPLRLLPYAWAGATFSMGLMLSGMADPAKVLSFLHIPGTPGWAYKWDPSLMMVMLFAVLPNALFYRRLTKKAEAKGKGKEGAPVQPKPRLSWAKWSVPSRTDVDARLIAGAMLFGVGWGLGGVCPGPAIVGLASAATNAVKKGIVDDALKASATFVCTMLLGMASSRLL